MEKEIPDGGSAFPQWHVEPLPGGGSYQTLSGGMSLRDYFAGQFAQEALRAAKSSNSMQDVARVSYELADAMLAERGIVR